MNKNQGKGQANEAKRKSKEVAGKVIDDESAQDKDNSKKQGGKDRGAVSADVSSASKKKTR